MSPRIAVAVSAVALFTMLGYQARAADPISRDPDRAAWFKSLRVPGGGALCCDISDGHPVQARWADGHWQVWFGQGPWQSVPDEIVLDEGSIDEHAYLFVWNDRWRCFIKPNNGS